MVPARAVLVLQQHGLAGRRGARVEARRLELEQRLQPVHLRVGRCQGSQHPGEAERLEAEVGAHPGLARGGGVPLVEHQVDHRHHVVQTSGALGAGRHLQHRTRLGEGPLGPRDPLPHSGVLDQEPARDLLGGQPADQPERQGRPGLRRQRRVAGQEHQAQHVVLDVVDLVDELGHRDLREFVAQAGDLLAVPLGAAERVDRPAFGHRHQPGAGVGRYAVARPRLQGGDERVLGEVLGEGEVAGHPGQAGDHACRLELPDRDDGLLGRGGHEAGGPTSGSPIRRTSAEPSQPGQ